MSLQKCKHPTPPRMRFQPWNHMHAATCVDKCNTFMVSSRWLQLARTRNCALNKNSHVTVTRSAVSQNKHWDRNAVNTTCFRRSRTLSSLSSVSNKLFGCFVCATWYRAMGEVHTLDWGGQWVAASRMPVRCSGTALADVAGVVTPTRSGCRYLGLNNCCSIFWISERECKL